MADVEIELQTPGGRPAPSQPGVTVVKPPPVAVAAPVPPPPPTPAPYVAPAPAPAPAPPGIEIVPVAPGQVAPKPAPGVVFQPAPSVTPAPAPSPPLPVPSLTSLSQPAGVDQQGVPPAPDGTPALTPTTIYGVPIATYEHLPPEDQAAIRAEFYGQHPPAIGGFAPPTGSTPGGTGTPGASPTPGPTPPAVVPAEPPDTGDGTRTTAGTHGPSYTFTELTELWQQAGGPYIWAATAAGIALAESSGCVYAHAGPHDDRPKKSCTYRDTDGENSYGLWQINRDAHPQFIAKSLYTAKGNAAAAVAVWNAAGSFDPWTTYRDGSYKKYLQQAGAAGLTVAPPASVDAPQVQTAWAAIIDTYTKGVPAQHAAVVALNKKLIGVMKQ